MSVEYLDSFDFGSDAQLVALQLGFEGCPAGYLGFGSPGRWGGTNNRYLELIQSGAYVEKWLTSVATRIVGVAVWMESQGTYEYPFLRFYDGSTLHLELRVGLSGQIRAMRGGSTQIGVSANGVMLASTWYGVQAKVTIDDSSGVVEVRLNGASTPVLNLTGVDTRNGGNATTNRVRLSSVDEFISSFTHTNKTRVDDLVIMNTSGSSPHNTFPGELHVSRHWPTADGNSSDYARSTGSDNYALVDEMPTPNDDTDYVESATPGDVDLYGMSNLASASGSIFAAQVRAYAKRTGVVAREISLGIRSGGTDDFGALETLTAGYKTYLRLMELNPVTAAAFTHAEIDAIEVGQKMET